MNEEFLFYRPCRELQPYVRYYWTFRSDRPKSALTFPIGCTQLIFHKRSPLYIPELGAAQERLTVSGQVDFPSHLCSDGDTEMLAVVFRPHAMSSFLHVPTSLFCNREVSGYDLGNRSLEETAGRIFDCGDASRSAALLEQWLLSRLAGAEENRSAASAANLKRVEAALRTICAAPGTSVAELAAGACLSRRQFDRLFGSLVGMNPRKYARIVRFHKALKQMRSPTGGTGWAQIAYSSGYADQSHFIREFKRFSGHTPASLPENSTSCADLFTDPA